MKTFWGLFPSFIIAVVLGAVLVLVFPPSPYKNALKIASEGDLFLQNGLDLQALERYKQAQKQWPPLRIDIGFQNQLNKAKEGLKEAAGVTIFLKEAANNSQVQALIKEIEAVDGVREVKFISKEEALRTFQERNKDSPKLLEKASKEALPNSIAVFLDDLSLKKPDRSAFRK